MAFICKKCYEKLHPKEEKPTMWDIFLKSFGPCETCWPKGNKKGDKSAKLCVDM